MSLVATFTTRLALNATFKVVAGAAQLAIAMEKPPVREKRPAVFVIRPLEDAAANPSHTATSQVVTEYIETALALGGYGDERGAEAADDLDAARAAVKAQLFGWIPDATHRAVEFRGGRTLGFANQTLWWVDRWSTQTLWSA